MPIVSKLAWVYTASSLEFALMVNKSTRTVPGCLNIIYLSYSRSVSRNGAQLRRADIEKMIMTYWIGFCSYVNGYSYKPEFSLCRSNKLSGIVYMTWH